MMEPTSEESDERGSYRLILRHYDPAYAIDGLAGEKDDDELSVIMERELVKKLDRRIMPCLFAMIVLKYAFPGPEIL
jgi:hypothetical protein